MTNLTLPTDSADRKEIPLFDGCLAYFPAALAGVARHSKINNDRHNPGEPLHHARGKSADHENCILRHLTDLADLRRAHERGVYDHGGERLTGILAEANALAWRALALSQELHEKYGGAPLAPGARLPEPERVTATEVRQASSEEAQPEREWGPNAGVRPVPGDVVVEYRTLEGLYEARADQLRWTRLGSRNDIIAWRRAV